MALILSLVRNLPAEAASMIEGGRQIGIGRISEGRVSDWWDRGGSGHRLLILQEHSGWKLVPGPKT